MNKFEMGFVAQPQEKKEDKLSGIKNMAKVLSLAFLGLSATNLEAGAQNRKEGPTADIARHVTKMAYENPKLIANPGMGPEINIGNKNQINYGRNDIIVGGYDKLTYVATNEDLQNGQITRHNTMIIDVNSDGSPDLFLNQSIKQEKATMAVKEVTPGVIEFADGTMSGDIIGDPSRREEDNIKKGEDERFNHAVHSILTSVNLDMNQVNLDDIKKQITSEVGGFDVSTINELSPEEKQAAEDGFKKALQTAEQALEKMNEKN